METRTSLTSLTVLMVSLQPQLGLSLFGFLCNLNFTSYMSYAVGLSLASLKL